MTRKEYRKTASVSMEDEPKQQLLGLDAETDGERRLSLGSTLT